MVDRMSELFGYKNTDGLIPKRSSSIKSISNISRTDIVYSDNINVLTKELLKATLVNQKVLKDILKELKDEADDGEFMTLIDTVTTTDFQFINTTEAPGHPVKGYAISNEGPNTIYVAHNVSKANIVPDLIDVTTTTSRFQQVLSTEEIRFIFNRRKVRNIAILARDGNSTFRAWLTW